VFAAYASYSNGNDVDLVLEVGSASHGMYLRCVSISGDGASCDASNQTTVTVHARDRVHVTVRDAEGGGHRHDFNIEGWQYFLWPNSPEMELEGPSESTSFTAWASGTYHILCEIPGHDAAGMHGTFVVV